MEQEHLFRRPVNRKHRLLLINQLLSFVQHEKWLPDILVDVKFDFSTAVPSIVNFNNYYNVLTDGDGVPKIIDFTNYFDRFRMTEKRMEEEVAEKIEILRLSANKWF